MTLPRFVLDNFKPIDPINEEKSITKEQIDCAIEAVFGNRDFCVKVGRTAVTNKLSIELFYVKNGQSSLFILDYKQEEEWIFAIQKYVEEHLSNTV